MCWRSFGQLLLLPVGRSCQSSWPFLNPTLVLVLALALVLVLVLVLVIHFLSVAFALNVSLGCHSAPDEYLPRRRRTGGLGRGCRGGLARGQSARTPKLWMYTGENGGYVSSGQVPPPKLSVTHSIFGYVLQGPSPSVAKRTFRILCH